MDDYRYNFGVIKAGSDVTDNPDAIRSIADQIQILREKKLVRNVAIVSSGAVSEGKKAMNGSYDYEDGNETTVQKQVLASKGQARMFRNYEEELERHGLVALQVPITWTDFHRTDFRAFFSEVLENPNFVPIINENDVTCARELHPDHAGERYHFEDNDELSSRLARAFRADLYLCLCGEVDGLYRDVKKPETLIGEVEHEDTVWDTVTTSASSKNGSGTMRGKCYQISLAADEGILSGIVRGDPDQNTIVEFAEGEDGSRPGTTFLPKKVA